jgi:heptosyltransferase III
MEKFRSILVVVPAQLGDVLICTPLIRAARLRWRDARIDVLGFAGTLETLRGNPDVNELIEIPRAAGRKAQWRHAWKLRGSYDLALVTRITDRAHLYGLVAAGVRSAVILGRGVSFWKRYFTHYRVVARPGVHQVLQNLQLLHPWAEAPRSVSLLPPPAVALPAAIETRITNPCVVVHVPSMWRYKQWPTEHFREVIQALLADNVQVILTGSDSTTDQAQIAQVRDAAAPPKLLDVSGQLSIPQVRALLQRADAYLGPDTSVTHMAAAVGVPTVTLFGPTNPQDFGPWPSGHAPTQPWQRRALRQQVGPIVVLQGADLPGHNCVPCNRMGCENRHDSASHCLVTLQPSRVLDELRNILQPQIQLQDEQMASAATADRAFS